MPTDGRIEQSSSRRWQVGVATVLAAIATIVYGAYGDPDPKSDQQAAVPFLVGAIALAAAFVYGWLVRKGSARPGELTHERTRRWALGLSVIGLLLVPVVFWSGLPIVLGGAGSLLGSQLRNSKSSPTANGRSAVVVGVLAIAANVVVTILSNTVL